MIIKLQREVVMPNAVFVPQIVFSTSPRDGVLETSANLSFQTAVVDEKGKWAPMAHTGNLYISNILAVEPDISVLQTRINQLYADMIGIVSDLNDIRKVI